LTCCAYCCPMLTSFCCDTGQPTSAQAAKASAPTDLFETDCMRTLTLARDLRRRKARERADMFVAEGVRAVEELLGSHLAIRGALVGPQLAQSPRGAALRAKLEARGVEVAEISEREFASAADTESPQGVLAVAAIPERGWGDVASAPGGRLRVLVLDGVQDPGNVGTILRTAAALGASATAAMPGTVDLWNAKVVRSAMGALFSHPAFASSWDAFDRFRAERGVSVWGADAKGEPLGQGGGEAAGDRLALVVGNEGAGLSASARARVDRLVSLPIAGVESLNAAVAVGILLYELRPA
jgi:RNA methyltransferase, TrmH family